MLTRDAKVLEHLVELAERAGKLIAQVYRTDFAVEYKGPSDPVTDADQQANDLICRELQDQYPAIPVVAEESDPESFRDFRQSDEVFFVDPLDGTKEFVAKNGEFVVMIGLVQGDRATLGVVHSPVSGETWLGDTEQGAHHITAQGSRCEIQPSRTSALADAQLVASRSHASAASERAVQKLGIAGVTPMGSAGLKGARVADGTVDVYLSLGNAGKRWDACAVDAIVTAAGGKFSDSFGSPIDYRALDLSNSRGLLACTSTLQSELLERLSRVRRER